MPPDANNDEGLSPRGLRGFASTIHYEMASESWPNRRALAFVNLEKMRLVRLQPYVESIADYFRAFP